MQHFGGACAIYDPHSTGAVFYRTSARFDKGLARDYEKPTFQSRTYQLKKR
jgi:hypothetical protein